MDSSDTRSYETFTFKGVQILPGETREVYLKISESYLSSAIPVPVTVIRGKRPGPVVFVVAAVHGDEINGADIVRRLIFDVDHHRLSGTLIAIPVVNIPGFLNQSRYLTYHRDLNRFFPGKKNGNNAERMAWRLFREVILKCDFGIDLHTAAHGRMNLPHVRGDMKNPKVREIAKAFGVPILIDQPGVKGSLRAEATRAGVPTLLFEAGEAGRFSHKISREGLRGVLNVLSHLKMYSEKPIKRPRFQVIVKTSDWVRADKGGILDLSVRPGSLVYRDDPIACILNPFGKTVTQVRSPVTGIVVGVTTAPLAVPGTGIIHVARLKKALRMVEKSIKERKQEKR